MRDFSIVMGAPAIIQPKYILQASLSDEVLSFFPKRDSCDRQRPLFMLGDLALIAFAIGSVEGKWCSLSIMVLHLLSVSSSPFVAGLFAVRDRFD